MKVLITGPPQGKLDALFKRVATVNGSSGPFDLLLCCGAFFPAAGMRRRGGGSLMASLSVLLRLLSC